LPIACVRSSAGKTGRQSNGSAVTLNSSNQRENKGHSQTPSVKGLSQATKPGKPKAAGNQSETGLENAALTRFWIAIEQTNYRRPTAVQADERGPRQSTHPCALVEKNVAMRVGPSIMSRI